MAKRILNKQNFFTYMNVENQGKNWFDLSHPNSGSCNLGQLVPVLCTPTLPDDYHVLNLSYMIRLAQMVAPPMTRLKASFFAFYCPNRILMDSKKWDKFLADVDGNSGVGLPSLSFSPIYQHILNSVNEFRSDNSFLSAFVDVINNDDLLRKAIHVPDEEPVLIHDEGFEFKLFSNSFEAFINYQGRDMYVREYLLIRFTTLMGSSPFKGTLLDYFGFPVNSPLLSYIGHMSLEYDDDAWFSFVPISNITPSVAFQVLPLVAYLYIWNEYFRQEFIQEEVPAELLEDFNHWKVMIDSDISYLWTMKRRDWEHDYYTSCLPAPQLGESAAITIGEDGKFTIPELREGNAIQKIREKFLHGGTRVFEILRNFFSSHASDARLQIPEFIAGSSSYLKISDIYQTAPGGNSSFPEISVDGNVASPRGASVNVSDRSLSFKFKTPEHGYIIALMSICPEPIYSQGIPRHFLSLDCLDYGFPDFANITEQPVYKYELYATPQNVNQVGSDYPIFGWQPQYSWYKFANGELHGELRDDLDFFHFGRIFDTEPSLNDEFLQCNPTDRPFPISYEYDKVTYHLHFDHSVERRLPYYGIPSLR